MATVSLRLRLLLISLATIAATLALAGVGLTLLFSQHIDRRIDRELLAHLDQLTAVFSLDQEGDVQLVREPSDPRFTRPYGGLYWQISRGVTPLRRSRSLWDVSLALPPDDLSPGEVHRHRLEGPIREELVSLERQVYAGPSERTAPFRLMVAISKVERDALVADFAGDVTWGLAGLAMALLLAAGAQISFGLLPFRSLRLELERVRRRETDHLTGSFPSEVAPLVDELNGVLAEQKRAIERAKAHAGNIAHALKTPLTILGSIARRHGISGESREIAVEIDDQIDAMSRAIDRELVRARTIAEPDRAAPVVLHEAIDRLLRTIKRLPRGDGLRWGVDVDPRWMVRVHPQDLEEILGNVLDNARKWARSRVHTEVQICGRRTILSVSDDGPGLPAEAAENIFDRGKRFDERVQGSGLGLAVVRDLTELYGGTVTAGRSEEGGLRVVIDLPSALGH